MYWLGGRIRTPIPWSRISLTSCHVTILFGFSRRFLVFRDPFWTGSVEVCTKFAPGSWREVRYLAVTWVKIAMQPLPFTPNCAHAVLSVVGSVTIAAVTGTTANMWLFSAKAVGFVAPTAGTFWSQVLVFASITPSEF